MAGSDSVSRLTSTYLTAKQFVVDSGYLHELEWQQGLDLQQISESDFLRESAWVVISTGMREKVVRQKFPSISEAFLNWNGAASIAASKDNCISQALRWFNHPKKIWSVAEIACRTHAVGFERIKRQIVDGGVQFLRTLPFIGPITSFHLAKNLGLDVVKPDRHLQRIAAVTNFEDPRRLCEMISAATGDKLCVVDLVLWRFATLENDYRSFFKAEANE